jgi:hypothetical protein
MELFVLQNTLYIYVVVYVCKYLARCIKYVAPIIQLVSRDHVCRFENESQHGEMMV